MTKQEIFDKVWKFFIVEKHKKSMFKETCLYRSRHSRCAVGCLIPDELYSKDMETLPISELMKGIHPLSVLLGGRANVNLLQRLQAAHDASSRYTFYAQLKFELKDIARDFKLQVPAEV